MIGNIMIYVKIKNFTKIILKTKIKIIIINQ